MFDTMYSSVSTDVVSMTQSISFFDTAAFHVTPWVFSEMFIQLFNAVLNIIYEVVIQGGVQWDVIRICHL